MDVSKYNNLCAFYSDGKCVGINGIHAVYHKCIYESLKDKEVRENQMKQCPYKRTLENAGIKPINKLEISLFS